MPFDRSFWFNFVGVKQTDDEMRLISEPFLEVQYHVTLKCLQAGALVGYLGGRIGLPLHSRIKGKTPMSGETLVRMACKYSARGMVVGALVALPMIHFHKYQNKLDTDDYYDRAYRIRYNTNQQNVDRLSLLMGAGYGLFFMRSAHRLPFHYGFGKGLCWGTLLAGAYNSQISFQSIAEKAQSAAK